MSGTNGFSFELDGLDELKADLETVVAEYPEEAGKKIYNLGGKFTKDVNSKFPGTYGNGKRPFAKSWKRERQKTLFTGYTVAVDVRNTAPHFHLVENGHALKIPKSDYASYIRNMRQSKNSMRDKTPGKSKKGTYTIEERGFVPGKHYCEKTRNEWKDKFPSEIETFVDKMLKGKNL